MCGVLFFLSLVSIAGQAEENDDGTTQDPACDWCAHFKWAAIAAIICGWPPILKKSWGAVSNKSLDINTLMTIAVAGALVIGEFVEAAAVVFLFSLSEWLERRATEKARVAISEVISA